MPAPVTAVTKETLIDTPPYYTPPQLVFTDLKAITQTLWGLAVNGRDIPDTLHLIIPWSCSDCV